MATDLLISCSSLAIARDNLSSEIRLNMLARLTPRVSSLLSDLTGVKSYRESSKCRRVSLEIEMKTISQMKTDKETDVHRLRSSFRIYNSSCKTSIENFTCLLKLSHVSMVQENNIHELEKDLSLEERNRKKHFICNYCCKAFALKGDLNRHVRIHTGEKPYICHHGGCKKLFSLSMGVRDHIRRHHTFEKAFQCSFSGCDKRFVSSGERSCHRRTHTGEMPHKCQFNACQKTFRTKSRRGEHVRRRHTFDKPFKCDHAGCKMRFVTSSELVQHSHMHTSEKPFVCGDCGHRSKFASSLRIHMRVHTGVKPYVCSKCSRLFSNISNRTRHERRCNN